MSLVKENYMLERAALGLLDGCKRVQLYGYLSALSTSERTIWRNATAYVQLTSAVAFEVISSSAADTAAGTGARTVDMDLVDGNGVETTVTATLNGTGAVAITGTYVACNAIRVATAGSGGTNAGAIDVRAASGGAIKNSVNAAFPALGGSSSFIYTVPAKKKAYLKSLSVGVTGATGDLTLALSLYSSSGLRTIPLGMSKGIGFTAINDGSIPIDLGSGIVIPENTLIHLGALASTGAGACSATGELFVFDGASNILGL